MKQRQSYVSSPNYSSYKKRGLHNGVAQAPQSNKNVVPKDVNPLNQTQAIKITSATNSAFKIFPNIQKGTTSASLDRSAAKGFTATIPARQATGELIRVENFKRRDLRGGKRTRQTHLSVIKTSSNMGKSLIAAGHMRTERKTTQLAISSPSTQDESIAHTLSSKGNQSNGLQSDMNLQCCSPMAS